MTRKLTRTLAVCILGAGLAVGAALAIMTARPAPAGAAGQPATRTPQALDPSAPTQTVKLIFIHHSTGQAWLSDWHGQLALALRDSNYFVSDTNYGWGPADQDVGYDTIGDHTDIGHWYNWFAGPHRDTYLAALYPESNQTFDYSRLAADPGGENEVILFKSCFPNSTVYGNPNDPPTTGDNPLRGGGAGSEHHTVGNIKGIYNDLLGYFATRLDKLFVVVTAPPLQTSDTNEAEAANARAVNNWLVHDWLAEYPYRNVAVFDFYTVLTTNGGDPDTNDLGALTGNHHRLRDGAVEHIADQGGNMSAYPTGDSHPSPAGDLKATGEFTPLLNIAYHRWKAGAPPSPQLRIAKSVAVARDPVQPGDTITFSVRVTNAGGGDAAGVAVTDTLPPGLSGDNLNWTGAISAGQHIGFDIPAVVTTGAEYAGRTLTNTAWFTHSSSHGAASAAFAIARLTRPDLSRSAVTATPLTAAVWEVVTFTLVLSNTGDASATVRYTHELPAQVNLISGDLTGEVIVDPDQGVLIENTAEVVETATGFFSRLVVDDGVHAAWSSPSNLVNARRVYLPLVRLY